MDNTRTIWKYKIEVADESTIKVPAGAKVLSASEQNDNIVMYMLVPYDNDPDIVKDIEIRVVGTGHKIEFDPFRDFKFLATITFHHGSPIYHVFYKEGIYWG